MTTPATANDPITGLLDAFKSHDVVALCDGGHGCEQAYAFRIALIRDPRFPGLVNDIVVESGNSLYQSIMDRFISGEDIPDREICKAWQNTTQPHDVWDSPVFEGLFREVRNLNATLPKERQIRVLGSEQDLILATRGLYQPKAATADLMVMPPSGLLRIWRPVAARNTCNNCSAGGTRDQRVFILCLPFWLFRIAWPVTTHWDQRKPISWKYKSASSGLM